MLLYLLAALLVGPALVSLWLGAILLCWLLGQRILALLATAPRW